MSALGDFRPDVTRGPHQPGKVEWTPPTREDLGVGRILAVDQSLSRTGLVALEHDGTELWVSVSRTLRGVARGATGREKDLGEFTDLYAQFIDLLTPLAANTTWSSWEVVHETPPLGNGMRNAESSLLAAAALRAAVHLLGMPLLPSIAPVTHRTRMAGRTTFRGPGEGQITSQEGKRRYHEYLARTAASVGLDTRLVTNEGQRDALAIGLTELVTRRAL